MWALHAWVSKRQYKPWISSLGRASRLAILCTCHCISLLEKWKYTTPLREDHWELYAIPLLDSDPHIFFPCCFNLYPSAALNHNHEYDSFLGSYETFWWVIKVEDGLGGCRNNVLILCLPFIFFQSTDTILLSSFYSPPHHKGVHQVLVARYVLFLHLKPP